MAGNLGGTISLGDLMQHGSCGIGTFDGLDGEVVILDNEVYQADSTGAVHHVTDDQVTLPFASVHQPADLTALSLDRVDFAALNQDFVARHELTNVFAALRLHGTVEDITVRVAPKQGRPYPSLLEVAKGQPTFHRDRVSGTIIGYFAPAIFGTVTAAGWHLHFLSDDRQFAGHLLSFSAPHLTGDLQVFNQLDQHFPVADAEFRRGKVDAARLQEQIAQAEG